MTNRIFPSLFFLLFVIILINLSPACSGRQPANTSINNKSLPAPDSPALKPVSNYQDTIAIRELSAVFYQPDSLQLLKIKAITDPRIYESSMHEYFYQVKTARAYFSKFRPGLKVTDAKNVRFLLFTSPGKPNKLIDLDACQDAYGIFLFAPGKPPHPVDMTNIDSEVPGYFDN